MDNYARKILSEVYTSQTLGMQGLCNSKTTINKGQNHEIGHY
jgi:hypothetical protein